jgi:hypothetical protein
MEKGRFQKSGALKDELFAVLHATPGCSVKKQNGVALEQTKR